MADCTKLAKRRKLEEDPDAGKCQNCNTPGHEEENCYFGANMETRPPKRILTEAQKKDRSLQTSSKTHKIKNKTTSAILLQGFKLKTPRLNNQNAQITTKKHKTTGSVKWKQ